MISPCQKYFKIIPCVMGTGTVIFSNRIFEYIQKCPINPKRGEKELPDLINCAIADNQKVLCSYIADAYWNLNTPEQIIECKKWLSDQARKLNLGESHEH